MPPMSTPIVRPTVPASSCAFFAAAFFATVFATVFLATVFSATALLATAFFATAFLAIGLGVAEFCAPRRGSSPPALAGRRSWRRARGRRSRGGPGAAGPPRTGRLRPVPRRRPAGAWPRRARRHGAGWSLPAARSPAPVARRSDSSGLGSRMAAITRQRGQTQHSGVPVAKLGRPLPPLRPRAATDTAAMAAATRRSASSRTGSAATRPTSRHPVIRPASSAPSAQPP